MSREHFGPRGLPPGLTIDGYSVGEWCPTDDGSGPAVAVAMVFELRVRNQPISMVLGLHSRAEVNELIASLSEHRDSVFPLPPGGAN